MNLATIIALEHSIHAGGVGSGRNPYGKKDHEDFKKQVKQWEKELKNRRDLSPNNKHQELQNKIFPYNKGQKEIDHLKEIVSTIKDKVAKEFLGRVHEVLTDKNNDFDRYSDRSLAHAYLKLAEKESPGLTDKLEPSLVSWIKLAPASKDADDRLDAGGPGSGRHPEGEQFHGTAVKTIKSILKNGILPTDATLGYKAAFVTNSKDLAFSYGVGAAARAGKLKGAVVAIAVIKDPVKAGIIMVDGKSNLSVSKGGIKPEFIDRIEVYNWDAKKGDAPVKVIRASSNSGNNAYITLLIHNDINAGGVGSGRHKEITNAQKVASEWREHLWNRASMSRLAQLATKGGPLHEFHPGSVVVHRGVDSGSKNYKTTGTSWSKAKSVASRYGNKIISMKIDSHTPAIDINKLLLDTPSKSVIDREVFIAPKVINAGGLGSGCNGPNCGRPEKKYNGPEGKSAAERGGNAPAPFYKKSMDKQSVEQEKAGQKEMRQWRQQQPLAKSTSTVIQKGDEVKTLKVTRAFDNNKLEFKNYKPGTTLTVMEVLPKVGNNPQLMSVQYPQGDMVHMPVDDARLHKTLEGIQEKPAWKIRQEIGLAPDNVRPGRIAQQTETSTGARYTQLKPVTEGRPTGSGNNWKGGQPNPDEHSLKGSFNVASGPKGNKLSDIFTYEVNQKSIGQNNARATVWDANKIARTPAEAKNGTEGTTVIAWRDTTDKSGRVMEFNKDSNGYIKEGSQPMQSFNNLGHMGSYLKQRYGISMKLPGDSVARKKK